MEGTCSLLDHNLVLRTESEQRQIRYTMLETIREYGLERLTVSGEGEFTRRAHAAYCLVIAERAQSMEKPHLTLVRTPHSMMAPELRQFREIGRNGVPRQQLARIKSMRAMITE